MMPHSFGTGDELQANFHPDELDKSHWSPSTAADRRVKGPSTKCNTKKKRHRRQNVFTHPWSPGTFFEFSTFEVNCATLHYTRMTVFQHAMRTDQLL